MSKIKKSILKKIFLGIFTVSFGIFLFNGFSLETNTVFAQSVTDSEKTFIEEITDKVWYMNALLKIIYVVLWPLLVLAGISLDNYLVYGEVFNLDIPLRQIWNMMKNFANFTLGFVVLFEIIKGLFVVGQESIKKPIETIKNALIAGVLIQASWFLLGAVIDISTIATYAVGGLPSTVLEQSTELNPQNKQIFVLGTTININLKEEAGNNDSFLFYNNFGDQKYIAPCRIKKSTEGNKFIIGRESMAGKKLNDIEFEFKGTVDGCDDCKEICSYDFGQIVIFKGLVKYDKNETDTAKIWKSGSSGRDSYKTALDTTRDVLNKKDNADGIPNAISNNEIVEIKKGENFDAIAMGDKRVQSQLDAGKGTMLTDLLKKSEGFGHTLMLLYNSFMDFADLSDISVVDVNKTSITSNWLELLIKIALALALVIPLVMLGVVLVARVGYMWLIIAFSPFLILKRVFFKESKSKLFEKIPSVGDVIGIIFAPVITVFVLSLSLIFMYALSSTLKNQETNKNMWENMHTPTTTNANGDIGFGLFDYLIEIYENDATQNGLSFFSYLMINLFGIAIVRIIFFAALKANKVGSDILNRDATDFLTNIAKSVPIIKVEGEDGKMVGVGLGALEKLPDNFTSAMSNIQTEQSSALAEAMGIYDNDKKSENTTGVDQTYYDNLTEYKSGVNATRQEELKTNRGVNNLSTWTADNIALDTSTRGASGVLNGDFVKVTSGTDVDLIQKALNIDSLSTTKNKIYVQDATGVHLLIKCTDGIRRRTNLINKAQLDEINNGSTPPSDNDGLKRQTLDKARGTMDSTEYINSKKRELEQKIIELRNS